MYAWEQGRSAEGRGDFRNWRDDGRRSRELLQGAHPRELVNPDSASEPVQDIPMQDWRSAPRGLSHGGKAAKRRLPPDDWTARLRPGSPFIDRRMETDPLFLPPPESDPNHIDQLPPPNYPADPEQVARGGKIRRADGGDVEPPDYTDRYNTPLTRDQEQGFQSWLAAQSRAGDLTNYDMRGAWRSDVREAANGHYPDTYKKPNHPTYSTGSQYSTPDSPGGRWVQRDGRWNYTPSATNLQMYGPAGLRRYWDRAEPGADLNMRRGYDDGGEVADYSEQGIGGVAPTNATVDPRIQDMNRRFSGMGPEQLQEAVLRMGPNSRMGALAARVLAQKRTMPTPAAPRGRGLPQAPAAPRAAAQQQPSAGELGPTALKLGAMFKKPEEPAAEPSVYNAPTTDGGAFDNTGQTGTYAGDTEGGFARGGFAGDGFGAAGAQPASGFLNSAVAGRTDHINAMPGSGSYVLPADVVSGLGEGNSLAGAKFMQMALSTGPHGMPLPKGGGHAPRMSMRTTNRIPSFHRAAGGPAEAVPIMAAGGEFILTAEQVAAIGGGDIKRGHRILDAFVLHVRKKTIKEMRNLRGPVKS